MRGMHLANVRDAKARQEQIKNEDQARCEDFARMLRLRFEAKDVQVCIVRADDVRLRIKVNNFNRKDFVFTTKVKAVDGVVQAQDLIVARRRDVFEYLKGLGLTVAQVSQPG